MKPIPTYLWKGGLCIGLVMLLFSCSREQHEVWQAPMLNRVPSEYSGIDFSNVITENENYNLYDYEYVYNGGGVAVLDINNDTLPDIFFTGNMVSNRLYLNKGDFKFQDVTISAGLESGRWCSGVTIVDINNDSFQDIYVSVAGNRKVSDTRNMLYINNGDGSFTEEAEKYGIDDPSLTTQAAFFDYDRDGDMDLYLLNFGNEKWEKNFIYPKITDGSGSGADAFYRNNGDGTFSEFTMEAGILTEGYGLGISIFDINEDHYPDVYVSNDYLDDDLIYLNNQKGGFTESAASYLRHTSNFAMGNDIADINNDGLSDIMVVDMLPEYNEREKLFAGATNYDKYNLRIKNGYIPAYMRNTLQLNQGNGKYSEIGQLAGLHQTDWSWAPLLADFDNDGYRDAFVANGYKKEITSMDFTMFVNVTLSESDQKLKLNSSEEVYRKKFLELLEDLTENRLENYIFKNNGDLTFSKKNNEWGTNTKTFSNGAAYADLDRDGDLDLIVSNINDEAFVYNNSGTTEPQNYLKVHLTGDLGNALAFGTVVKLYQGKEIQVHEYYPNRGFQSAMVGPLHFGLGDHIMVDSLMVMWPDGKSETLGQIKANQELVLNYANARAVEQVKGQNTTIMMSVNDSARLHYHHQEDEFVDFKVSPLIPHRYSQNGPALAVGDINNDGMEDFLVGGSKGKGAGVFIQNEDGSFTQEEFPCDKSREDMGLLLFDADNDGDQDLYAVSGGSEEFVGGVYYLDRFYRNDGKGRFEKEDGAIPRINSSGSCVTAADFDKDGDLDLFVGGRVVPGNYPLPARSYLLLNEGGRFTDVTEAYAPGLAQCGMVTGALWTDFDNDNWIDLVLVGEWMPLTFYRNINGQLENVTEESGMTHTHGWWNSLASGDFDGDGDMDYVAGNLGLNTRYKASDIEPVTVFANDFDANGTLDAILNYFVNGTSYPVHSRDELGSQLPFVKKKFPKYADYAQATIETIIPEKELKESYVAKSYWMKSSYIENLGNGKFEVTALPVTSQASPVFGIRPADINGDGWLDLLLVGNSYAPEVEFGSYDSFLGQCLLGDGKGNFTELTSASSGFEVAGDAKALTTIVRDGKTNYLASQNQGELKIFQPQNQQEIVRLRAGDKWLYMEDANGAVKKYEFYYGDSYLSQSSHTMAIPKDAVKLTFVSSKGEERILNIQEAL